MMKFRKLPRKQLEDTLFFICSAQEILLRLYHEKRVEIDESDLELLTRITERSTRLRMTTQCMELCLSQRLAGLPETPLPPECCAGGF